MGELVLILGTAVVICATLVTLVLLVLVSNNRKELALKRAEQDAQIQIEREKNERILESERMKLERMQLSNEKAQLYVNRDITQAQIEAGVLGNQEEDNGIVGLIQQVMPVLAQNPELLGKLGGLLGRGTQTGGDAGTPATFPAGTDIPGNNQ